MKTVKECNQGDGELKQSGNAFLKKWYLSWEETSHAHVQIKTPKQREQQE